jgi:5-methylcytosine-specific restriction endonuclease McrA
MPNRILRDCTDSELKELVAEVDRKLASLPIATGLDRNVGSLKCKLYRRKRFIRMELAKRIASHTHNEWKQVASASGMRCSVCGSTDRPSKDHIISIAAGGSDGVDNLRLLCVSCNSRKGARDA